MTALLLLPGTLCDARVWAPVQGALTAAGCSLLSADLKAHRSAPAMASALLETMPDRCAIAGFSLGGIVALEMAAQAPQRVLGLALIATNARPDPAESALARRAAVIRARRTGIDAHVRGELLPRYFGSAHAQDRALHDMVLGMAIDSGIDAYSDQAEIAACRADSRPRLQAIRVPTLVIGGAEDSINPADRQQEMAHALPFAEWHQVAGAGHFVPLEAPACVAGLMRRWLQRLEPGRH